VERLRLLERGERPPEPREEEAPPPQAEPPRLDAAARRMAELLLEDGHEPRTDADLAVTVGLEPGPAAARLRELERGGQAVRVGPNLHFHAEPLARLVERTVAICERDGGATIAGVRDELGTSRKYAQALLEHLDARKVTRRVGDAHVLRRAKP
jgi:selenocysteine-specific elongation factor